MRYPIRSQILFILAATLVATIVVTSVAAALLNARRAEREIRQELERIIEVVQASAFPLTNNTLRQMQGLSGAEFVLTDLAGAQISASRDFKDLKKLRELSPDAAPSGLGAPVTIDGAPYFQRTVRVFNGPTRQPTLLHVLCPEANRLAAQREAFYPPLLAGMLGAVLALALSTILSRRIARPITSLATRMRYLSESGAPRMPLPERDDEIRDLVVTANAFSARIADLMATIRRNERLSVLGQLAGGIAHQLRNAAGGARLAVQLHARACHDDDRESLDNALRQLNLIEEQIGSLLSVGKPSPPRIAQFDLSELVDDVAGLVRPMCLHRGISLARAGVDEPVGLTGDRAQLRQAVLNLALNAIDAAERMVTLNLLVPAGERHAILEIIDDGPGIDPVIAEHLFEPFVTGKAEGIGLGLAVVRQIAEAHDAEISYERREGETVFALRMACGADSPADTALNSITTV